MCFGQNNLLPEGFVLDKFFYKIKLLHPPNLPSRPKVGLPPCVYPNFWYVVNALTIHDHMSKNRRVVIWFRRKNRKNIFFLP